MCEPALHLLTLCLDKAIGVISYIEHTPTLLQPCSALIKCVQVLPGATVQLLHSLVLKHKVGRLARSSASTLQLHFTLDAAQRATQPPRQVDCPWERPNLAPDQLPHPPALSQVGPPFVQAQCNQP